TAHRRGVEAEDDRGVSGKMELRGILGFSEFEAGKKQLLTASNGEMCLTKPRPSQGCRALMMMMMEVILTSRNNG
ncbi:jg17369, partial [Pararge aegeria aegeria]